MGFMQAYKRLDNLCRDMNGIGVTGYLQDMDETPQGAHRVPGCADDYRQLKYYRRLRNRIAHENDADEEELCTPADAAWVEDFHERILARTDPLAMCFSSDVQEEMPTAPLPARAEEKRPRGCAPELFMAAVVLAALAGLVFLGMHIVTTFY